MNLFKRAMLAIHRNMLKSIIMLLLITIMGIVVSGAISVYQGIHQTEANLRRRIPTVITLHQGVEASVSRPNLTFEDIESFFSDVVDDIGTLPYVAAYDYSLYALVRSWYIRRYGFDLVSGFEDYPPGEGYTPLLLEGFKNPELLFIEHGDVELIAGRTFTPEDVERAIDDQLPVALISHQFAQHNSLWIGDMMPFTLILSEGENHMDYHIQVIGIWEFANRQTSFSNIDYAFEQAQQLSRIFVPSWVTIEVNRYFYDLANWGADSILASNPHFILKDPTYIDDFKAAAYALLPEGWYLDDHSHRFEAIEHSTEMLLHIVDIAFVSTIGAAIIMLTLLITLFLHDRRHEIGIYLSLGEQRIKILLQVLVEVLSLSLVGVTISLFIGNLISSQLSQMILRNEITAFFENNQSWMSRLTPLELSFGYHELGFEQLIEAFDTSLSPIVILTFYAVGLIVITISTLIPILYLARLNPKKVLM